jgi:hypothetical protein
VVAGGIAPLVGVKWKVVLVQVEVVCAPMIGELLIVTLTLNGVPEQVPLVGVTLYVAVAGVRLLTRVRLPSR